MVTHKNNPIKIVIVTAAFPPEPLVTARTSNDIACTLADLNYLVTVLSPFPSRPGGCIFPGFQKGFFSREIKSQQLQVLRLFSIFSKKSNMISRWFENISFGMSTGLALLIMPRPTVVYSNSWPIFATGIVCLITRMRGVPLVISIQDLYPESLITQGRLNPHGWPVKILKAIDRWIVKASTRVIVISETFTKSYHVDRDLPEKKIDVIPNWINEKEVQLEERNRYRTEAGIPNDSFVITYGGNISVAAGVECLIKACTKIPPGRDIWLVVAGSGSQLSSCMEHARECTSVHVLFHTPWATEDTAKVLAASDVLVLPTLGNQTLASVPSKLLTYLLASRPVLAQALPETDIARIIEETKCGWLIPPDNIGKLADKIIEISNLGQAALNEMGIRGQEFVKKHFSKDENLQKVIKIIKEAGAY